jgi:hypothetical protein
LGQDYFTTVVFLIFKKLVQVFNHAKLFTIANFIALVADPKTEPDAVLTWNMTGI